jgi:leader peptidase (prepilin peptidase)/N-methyltransferase
MMQLPLINPRCLPRQGVVSPILVLTLADLPPWLFRVFGPLFGLLWGSFLNVVIYRVPEGLSVVSPPSHCPACQAPIKIYDNIPVLGWLLLRGKARCCGAKVSPRYPAIEAMGGLLAWAIIEIVIFRLPPDTSLGRCLAIFGADLALALALVAAAFIDLDHLYIPDAITLGGALFGLATVSFRPPMTYLEAGVGAIGGFLMVWLPFDVLYRALRGRTGMALGDAKLVMLAGAWFGIQGAVFALVAGSLQGSLAAGAMFLFKGKLDEPEAVERERAAILAEIAALPEAERAEAEKELAGDPLFEKGDASGLGARIPFGPFLAIAIIEFLLVGHDVVNAILNP